MEKVNFCYEALYKGGWGSKKLALRNYWMVPLRGSKMKKWPEISLGRNTEKENLVRSHTN